MSVRSKSAPHSVVREERRNKVTDESVWAHPQNNLSHIGIVKINQHHEISKSNNNIKCEHSKI